MGAWIDIVSLATSLENNNLEKGVSNGRLILKNANANL